MQQQSETFCEYPISRQTKSERDIYTWLYLSFELHDFRAHKLHLEFQVAIHLKATAKNTDTK